MSSQSRLRANLLTTEDTSHWKSVGFFLQMEGGTLKSLSVYKIGSLVPCVGLNASVTATHMAKI